MLDNVGGRHRRRFGAVLALSLALASCSPPVVDEQFLGGAAARFSRLEDAVASGRLDEEVVSALRDAGTVEAGVLVDEAGVIGSVGPAVEPGQVHIATRLRDAFARRKQGINQRAAGAVRRVRDFEYLPSMLVEIDDEAALLRLVNDPEVAKVVANRRVPASVLDSESSVLVRQRDAAAAGHTGAGTVVAVIDSGVDYRHPDLGSCVSPGVGTSCRVAMTVEVAADDGVLDDTGHGTNVSAIVVGMAPLTSIYAYDVFEYDAAALQPMAAWEDINWAMSDVIARAGQGAPIVAVNLSLGGGHYASACDDGIGFATARAVGVLPVVAAGNDTYTTGIAWPACSPSALSVGAVYDATGVYGRHNNCWDATTAPDKVVCFSNSGPPLKMLAPGSAITGGGWIMSGTSQATPHVAGATALLAAFNRTAGPNGWEAALVRYGTPVVDRDGVRRNRLDVVAALNALVVADRTPPTVSAPAVEVALNTALGSSASVNANWSATDPSGIAAYEVYTRVNGGTWRRETLSSATTVRRTFSVAVGATFEVTVAALDGAGNWSGYTSSRSFRVLNYSEASTAIRYSTGWSLLKVAGANGGAMMSSSTARATATFSFTGRAVAWIGTLASNRGVAYFYVDGAYFGSRDLQRTSTLNAQVLFSVWWPTSGAHTVQVYVSGTPMTRPAVDVDSFVALT